MKQLAHLDLDDVGRVVRLEATGRFRPVAADDAGTVSIVSAGA